MYSIVFCSAAGRLVFVTFFRKVTKRILLILSEENNKIESIQNYNLTWQVLLIFVQIQDREVVE